jgi:hypothetical protein
MEPEQKTSLNFLIGKFKNYYDQERSFKRQMEQARELKEQWEETLLAKMLEEDIQNIQTKDEVTFYARDDLYAGYDKDREAEMFDYLQKGGNEYLIRPTVNAKTLTAWVKEQLEEGVSLPDFINLTTKHRVGVRNNK